MNAGRYDGIFNAFNIIYYAINDYLSKVLDNYFWYFWYISGSNPCEKNNNGCKHLCFFLGGNTTKCDCASGFTISSDGISCMGTKSFVLYTTTTGELVIPFFYFIICLYVLVKSWFHIHLCACHLSLHNFIPIQLAS